MTPEARAFIVKCFCRHATAEDTAYCTNELFHLEFRVTAEAVERIWDQERATNAIVRQLESKLGLRPRKGYVPCEHARLAERLVAV